MSFARQQSGLFVSDEIRRQIPLFIRLSPEELNKSSVSVKTRSILKDHIPGGLADKKPASFFSSRAVKRGAKVEREHALNPSIAREIARDHLAEDKKYYEKLSKIEKDRRKDRRKDTKKAIPGQQEFMARVGEKDPIYATHTPNIHVEAAKHYIQADYHNRQPGGRPLSEHHSQQFGELQKQGAAPKAEHFKTAMHQLHPKFSQAMKSNNPSLYVKALTNKE